MNPSAGPSFEHLPAALPQSAVVKRVVEGLWQRQEVKAVWLGGSLAEGSGDLYSDIDLRVAVDPRWFDEWASPEIVKTLAVCAVGEHTLPCGDDTVLHHVLLGDAEREKVDDKPKRVWSNRHTQ